MTEDGEKFDVIVVGAGPGGSAAAYSLAKMGFNVLIIERGKYPGAKNMTGGRMYAYALNKLIPEFWKEAPVERAVTKERITMQGGGSSITIDFQDEKLLDSPNSFTILRAKFDPWLAQKAVDAGAILIPGIKVDDLLWEDGKVAGIIAGPDKIKANVVIAADGAVSLISEKAGLKKFESKEFAIGIKEVIELSEKTIEERFNLAKGEGAAHLFLGCTESIQGGGFVYTNKSSLSVGIVLQLDKLIGSGEEAFDVFCKFKKNLLVSKMIEGGKEVEYSAHVIPEGSRSELAAGGILIVGDAAGFVVNTGLTVRGIDMAIASGIVAAEAIKKASEEGDFSKESLSLYEQLIKKDSTLGDLETFKGMPEFLRNERLYALYPELICKLFRNVSVVGGPKKKLSRELIELTKGKKIAIILDLIGGLRSL